MSEHLYLAVLQLGQTGKREKRSLAVICLIVDMDWINSQVSHCCLEVFLDSQGKSMKTRQYVCEERMKFLFVT